MESSNETSTPSSINTTRKRERSSLMHILQTVTKPLGPKISAPKGQYPPGSPKLDVHDCAKDHCNVAERTVEDIHIYDLTPKTHGPPGSSAEKARTARQLYYFAGGSWQTPPSKEHWAFCAEIARQIPTTRVSIVSCPLAPSSPAPETMPHLLRAYKRLLHDAQTAGERVILAGDSSGGEIILCLTTNALAEDPHAPAPAALIQICPSVDLRQANPAQTAIETHDPLLRIHSSKSYAETWRGEWANTDPRINPIFADLAALAKANVRVHGVVGGNDILRPDALVLRDLLAGVGVRGEWLDWDKQMHGFPLTWTYGLSNGKEAKDWILELIRAV